MGRDSYRYRQLDEERAKRGQVDPIWRGIGCVMIVAIGAIGFASANWFLRANSRNNWLYMPREIMNPSILPFLDPYLANGVLLKVVIVFIIMLAGFGLVAAVYAIANPIQPGEFDAPPPRRRGFRSRKR
jgi:hypothetical protein